jgi:hypothetical protein
MNIEPRSLMSGIIRTLKFNVTEAEIEAWESGITPLNLDEKERDFIDNQLFDIVHDDEDEEIDYFSD